MGLVYSNKRARPGNATIIDPRPAFGSKRKNYKTTGKLIIKIWASSRETSEHDKIMHQSQTTDQPVAASRASKPM